MDWLFEVDTKWCGNVVLAQEQWDHVVRRHPEVEPYLEQIRETLLRPNLVYETPHVKPTIAFYGKGLIEEPRFRGCWVAVFVRSAMEPARVWTAYLPARLANVGNLIHAER